MASKTKLLDQMRLALRRRHVRRRTEQVDVRWTRRFPDASGHRLSDRDGDAKCRLERITLPLLPRAETGVSNPRSSRTRQAATPGWHNLPACIIS